jgi:hypothetical protein
MLLTMQNSKLIDKRIALAGGDVDLIRHAIRASSDSGKAALERVVNFIVEQRKARIRRNLGRRAMGHAEPLHTMEDYENALKEIEAYFEKVPALGTEGAARFELRR